MTNQIDEEIENKIDAEIERLYRKFINSKEYAELDSSRFEITEAGIALIKATIKFMLSKVN